jgi:hypothetical protein
VPGRGGGESGSGASLFLQRSPACGDWMQPSGESGALNPSGMSGRDGGDHRERGLGLCRNMASVFVQTSPPLHSTRHGRAAIMLRAIVDASIRSVAAAGVRHF